MLHALRYAKSHTTKGRRLGRDQIPQRSEEEFCGTLGPTLGPLCASSMAKKTPKKGPPDPPQKGPPGPPKKDPPKGPPEIPKAKGGRAEGGSDLGGFGARTAVYIYYGG